MGITASGAGSVAALADQNGIGGAGLVFAGVSNTCMIASVLARLPWKLV